MKLVIGGVLPFFLSAKTMPEGGVGLRLDRDIDVVWPPAALAVSGELKLVESCKQGTVSQLLLSKTAIWGEHPSKTMSQCQVTAGACRLQMVALV